MITHFLCLSGVPADGISLDSSGSLGPQSLVRVSDDAEGTEVVTSLYSLTQCFLSSSLWAPPPAYPQRSPSFTGCPSACF